MEAALRQRLAGQLSRGDVILFTGAGFSTGAKNAGGAPLPSAGQLRELLWDIAFPGQPIDNSTLGDVYACAAKRAGGQVRDLLRERLTVAPGSLPKSYEIWLAAPWLRMYTLNVDDLDEAAAQVFGLSRALRSVSAITGPIPATEAQFLSIHLNGRSKDYPDVTFSQRQYAERSVSPDPWYHHLVNDLISHPILFVGTSLDEPIFWQYVELRQSRERRARELRPGSYLVTKHLPLARRASLEDFNVQFVDMTQEEFAESVLATLNEEYAKGLIALAGRSSRAKVAVLEDVGRLREQPEPLGGEYLLGREPDWSDITSGRAVVRKFEAQLREAIDREQPQVVFVTGTAGAGKSTTIMRLALQYQAQGKKVLWVDRDVDVAPRDLRVAVQNAEADVVAIDDADRFGSSTGPFLLSLCQVSSNCQFLLGMRTTRFDRLEPDAYLKDVKQIAFTVPNLQDEDIHLLIGALSKANRLGFLQGKTYDEQFEVFRDSAGRQLLVAMIQATSNQKFDEKVDAECRDLTGTLGNAYAIVAIATRLRHYLTRDEILLALGDPSNASLNAIDRLVKQHLLIEANGYQLRLRHRVIAERAVEYYHREGLTLTPLKGLAWTMATKVRPSTLRGEREPRLLWSLLNHEFLISVAPYQEAPREIYATVQDLLNWSYHYFLQAGSFEVHTGDVDLAKNLLESARSLEPDDYMVQTEWAYMTIKRACLRPTAAESAEDVKAAIEELEDAIDRRGRGDHYPYHVLGSQGLAWARRAPMSKDGQERLLGRLVQAAKQGVNYHPRDRELRQLATDLEREYLMVAVPENKRPKER